MSTGGLSPETSPLKRPRLEDVAEADEDQFMAEAGTVGMGGASSTQPGAPLFPKISRGLKFLNKDTHHFTKKFYFKIYANDWIRLGSPSSNVVIGFMTVIPWTELCMYLSPDEYLDCVRQSRYAKIKSTAFEMKLKSVRTPFDANSADVAEANGNLNFEMKRWDGLEQVHPFTVLDGDGPTFSNQRQIKTNSELIKTLYGTSLGQLSGTTVWPAAMRERGLSWRPAWVYNNAPGSATATGSMYIQLDNFISAIPIGEYETDSINTACTKMSEGYCFNKTYKPKNGLLTMASSAYQQPGAEGFTNPGKTRINTKIRFQDSGSSNATTKESEQYTSLFNGQLTGSLATRTVQEPDFTTTIARGLREAPNNNWGGDKCAVALAASPNQDVFDQHWNVTYNPQTSVTGIGTLQAAGQDSYGYPYNNDLGYYSIAKLENYDMFTSRNDPPIHHMTSMMLGAIPKTNKDNSIVNATFEFEVTTHCTVEMETAHANYINMAYNMMTDLGQGRTTIPVGYLDPYITAQGVNVYGKRWQQNETDVALYDNKFWNHSYGLAGKPTFEIMPVNAPLYSAKKTVRK